MNPIVALDSHYFECESSSQSYTAAVQFMDWGDSAALASQVTHCQKVGEYQPGSFYLRELPSLLKAIQDLAVQPRLLVIDGYVQFEERPGLGWHLYQALEKRCPIVGVAKNPFWNDPPEGEKTPIGIAVERGESPRPLYVTSIGVEDPLQAATWVKSMQGKYRIPTLLKLVDRLARDSVTHHQSDRG